MNESWRTITEEEVDKNPWWSHIVRRFVAPDGREGEYHFVHNDGAVMTFAQDADGRFVMIREYRYIQDRMSVSASAGGIERGETPAESAVRELREETGYETGGIVKLGEYAGAAAFSDEVIHVFLATALTKVGGHDAEVAEVLLMASHEIDDAILTGEIWDGHAIASWQLVKLHLGL